MNEYATMAVQKAKHLHTAWPGPAEQNNMGLFFQFFFSTIPAMVHAALWRLHFISHSAALDDINISTAARTVLGG